MYPDIAPLTPEEKRRMEIQFRAGSSIWVSSPLVARGVAGMFSNDPRANVEFSFEHAVFEQGFDRTSVALNSMSSSRVVIRTTEIHESWAKLTELKDKHKLKVSHSASARGNVSMGLLYTVAIDNECHPRYAIFTERPQRLMIESLDTPIMARRLHCEDGPALVWGDVTLWVIHGVEVDEQTVMRPETQTVDDIFKKEKNEEARRIRMERFGFIRLMEHSTTIERRDNYVENTKEALVELQRMRFLLCHCPSTARVYALQVPRTTSTCEEAQRWLWSGSSLDRDIKLNIIGRS